MHLCISVVFVFVFVYLYLCGADSFVASCWEDLTAAAFLDVGAFMYFSCICICDCVFVSRWGRQFCSELFGRSDSCAGLGLHFRSVASAATVRTKSLKGKKVELRQSLDAEKCMRYFVQQ